MNCEQCEKLGYICEYCMNNTLDFVNMKRLVKEGVDNNVIIYDCDTIPYRASKRLLKLIIAVVKRQNDKITRFIISPDFFVELDEDVGITVSEMDVKQKDFIIYEMFGIDTIETEFLDYDSPIYDYYKKDLGCTLPRENEVLIVIETENNTYLASY